MFGATFFDRKSKGMSLFVLMVVFVNSLLLKINMSLAFSTLSCDMEENTFDAMVGCKQPECETSFQTQVLTVLGNPWPRVSRLVQEWTQSVPLQRAAAEKALLRNLSAQCLYEELWLHASALGGSSPDASASSGQARSCSRTYFSHCCST